MGGIGTLLSLRKQALINLQQFNGMIQINSCSQIGLARRHRLNTSEGNPPKTQMAYLVQLQPNPLCTTCTIIYFLFSFLIKIERIARNLSRQFFLHRAPLMTMTIATTCLTLLLLLLAFLFGIPILPLAAVLVLLLLLP